MSLIQDVTQTQTTAQAESSSRADIMGKEDFLTLLVAQLQNQDPLNPDDPTEFTAQLAQFSQLEQLFNLNDSINNMVTSNANADKFSTLQTIGKYVVYQDSKFEYSGEGDVHLGYQLDGKATEVQITVEKNGSVIKVLDGTELTKGNHFITWDGLDEDGNPAGEGSYTIAISAKATEGESIAASPLIKSEVTGVDLTGEYGGQLQTHAGEVSFAAVLGVFEIEKDESDEEESEEDNTNSSPNYFERNATSDVASIADSLPIKDDSQISLNMNLN